MIIAQIKSHLLGVLVRTGMIGMVLVESDRNSAPESRRHEQVSS